MKRQIDRLAVILVGLALWQGIHWLSPFALASPLATVEKLAALMLSAAFWPHVRDCPNDTSVLRSECGLK